MTLPLFHSDSYLKEAEGLVTAIDDNGRIILDQSLFYPTGGGQPGDRGKLLWAEGALDIETAEKSGDSDIALVPKPGSDLPPLGAKVTQVLDWSTRFQHMRIHTALHLLSVVIPLPVSGGAISAEKGRLDFNMPEPLENKEEIEAALNALIARDLPISEDWITEAELDSNPGLVKTMSVAPPRGAGRVRLIRIGQGAEQVDLQPCGGTHVASTLEIGRVRLGKVEKKGRENRRVNLHLVED